MTLVPPRLRLGPARLRLERALSHRCRLGAGDERLLIDALISPLRYDVLVRERYLRFALGHLDLFEADFPAFVEASRQHEYHTWFRHVAIRYVRPGVTESETGKIDAAFRERITKTVALARSFAERGFDHRFPITIRMAGPVAITATGKHLAGRRFPSDGCHRLALLRASGHRYLEPDWYRLHEDPRWSPADNTHSLIPVLGINRADYIAFVSMGYTTETFHAAPALLKHIACRTRAGAEEVSQLIAVDVPLLADSEPQRRPYAGGVLA